MYKQARWSPVEVATESVSGAAKVVPLRGGPPESCAVLRAKVIRAIAAAPGRSLGGYGAVARWCGLLYSCSVSKFCAV
jgi:hypothetical protein